MQIRSSIKKMMSRPLHILGREFITGTDSFDFLLEGWSYVVAYCLMKNMTLFGPFKSSRKEMKLRSHFDYVCEKTDYVAEWLQFDTAKKRT